MSERKILIVDDNEMDRVTYKRFIKQCFGCEVDIQEAESGHDGLVLCRSQQPDCVIIDYNMPELNGIEFLQILNKKPLDHEMAIIFLTGYGDENIAVEAMKLGAHDYLLKSHISPERLHTAINQALKNVWFVEELKKKNCQIEKLARCDVLTGVLNRISFEDALPKAFSQSKRHRRNLALLFLDLDHFKAVNDSFGHEIGDLLLKKVTERLTACTRQEDLIARLGGDEFAIALPEIAHEYDAGLVAKKILEALSKKFSIQNKEIFISASVGIATYPNANIDISGLFKCADIAMYRAKELGKNNYQYYSEELNQRNLERLTIETALSSAIEKNQLFLAFQPQYDLTTHKIIGTETLLRWRHPELGEISPDKLIPIAEESGLISPIGQWVFEKACRQYVEWNVHNLQHYRLAINISPKEFLNKNFIKSITNIFLKTQINPNMIEMELTEAGIMKDVDHACNVLTQLREMGIHISIDDFGTGYSSLSELKNKLHIESLKIDKSFIQNIGQDNNDAMITKSIIDIANNLGLNVIAEGVENKMQMDFLMKNGCHLMQGYYLSKPLVADKMYQLLH